MRASSTAARQGALRIAVQVAVYVALYFAAFFFFLSLLIWLGGDSLTGVTVSSLIAAGFVNWLALRIYAGRAVADLGLHWRHASACNLTLGLIGGIGSAALALAPALAIGAAHIVRVPANQPVGMAVFVAVLIAIGAAGEEIFFRGYGFQILLPNCGPFATIVPVGVVFALMHGSNPNASWFGLVNTAGFGVLFGYAFLRSRDLWLPIGLHFGWNLTLPLTGANVSGLRMRLTGYEMTWTAGKWWSGGDYGPEASVLTSAVMFLLFAYLWKAPIRRQFAPLAVPPGESLPCESGRASQW
jgi:uncharacterized protein